MGFSLLVSQSSKKTVFLKHPDFWLLFLGKIWKNWWFHGQNLAENGQNEALINAKGKKVTKKNCERLFKKMIVFFCKKTPQLLFSKAFSNLPLENKLQTKETEKVTGCLTK